MTAEQPDTNGDLQQLEPQPVVSIRSTVQIAALDEVVQLDADVGELAAQLAPRGPPSEAALHAP